MLFYTIIFVASLIATLFANLSYKAISNKVRSVNTTYQRITITDSSRDYQRKMTEPTQPAQDDGVVFSPPGKMSPGEFVACRNQDTTWLVREQKLLSMYESYTARRSAESEPLTLEMISKPFRRSVPS